MGRFLSLFLLTITALPVFADAIADLRKEPVYVREGFREEWPTQYATGSLQEPWVVRLPNKGKEHSLSAKYLPFEPRYPRTPYSLDDSPDETFSYIFTFSHPGKICDPVSSCGLLLGSVGTRWQVYLNGHLIQDKLTDRGNNTRYNHLVPFSAENLREGENRLFFRIQGPRSAHYTGFFREKDYWVGPFETLQKEQSEFFPLALVTLYISLTFFHLLIFFRQPSWNYNLLFSGFTVMLAALIFFRTNFAFHFVPNSALVYKFQMVAYFVLPVLGLLFFRRLFRQKIGYLDLILAPLNLCLVIGTFLFSVSWLHDVTMTYHYFLPLIVFYILFGVVGSEFMKALAEPSPQSQTPFGLIWITLKDTVPGNIFFGTAVFLFIMLIDIVDLIFFYRGVFLSQYGFVVFVFAIAYALSNQFLKISEHNIELNSTLGNKLKELEYSDQKNKFIVDGTTDLLFIMGENYQILSMNSAAKKYFGVKPESLIGKNFMDLLYTTPKDQFIVQQLVTENLKTLDSPGKQARFRARIRSSRMQEPVEFSFRMEAVDAGNHLEFIGKATSSLDESLTAYIVEESQVYQIENYILLAEELSQRLVRVLKKKIPDYKSDAIRTGLREILINSIEHGNLNITFEEKSQYLSKGNYLDLIRNRQKDPVYGSRKVTVLYELTNSFVSYRITDEGNGFDYHELMKKAFANQSLGREHGRGIMLAENIFDVVEYLGKGNSVHLRVNF